LLAWMAAQHVLADVDMSQFAKLASWGFFGLAGVRKADVDKALDDVLKGLRAMEGLEEGGLARVGHISRGFASADFVRLVEGAVKAKLKADAEVGAEARRLMKARLVGKMAPQDEFDRFAANAAAAVETALGLIHRAVHWGRGGRPWPELTWLRGRTTPSA